METYRPSRKCDATVAERVGNLESEDEICDVSFNPSDSLSCPSFQHPLSFFFEITVRCFTVVVYLAKNPLIRFLFYTSGWGESS